VAKFSHELWTTRMRPDEGLPGAGSGEIIPRLLKFHNHQMKTLTISLSHLQMKRRCFSWFSSFWMGSTSWAQRMKLADKRRWQHQWITPRHHPNCR
jgi:hypothetical protein